MPCSLTQEKQQFGGIFPFHLRRREVYGVASQNILLFQIFSFNGQLSDPLNRYIDNCRFRCISYVHFENQKDTQLYRMFISELLANRSAAHTKSSRAATQTIPEKLSDNRNGLLKVFLSKGTASLQ